MAKSKHRYEIILYWSNEDQAYIAEVPELPGCAADGSSYQEAIEAVEDVIDGWDGCLRKDRKLANSTDPVLRDSLTAPSPIIGHTRVRGHKTHTTTPHPLYCTPTRLFEV